MTTLAPPRALLLDFGGVLVATTNLPDWVHEISDVVAALLIDAGLPASMVPLETIRRDVKAGAIGAGHWKNAMSRPYAPREMEYAEYWGDYVAADWPSGARDLVIAHAEELCRKLGHARQSREVREGIIEMLDRARACGVKVGIVSNSLSGQVHRDFLEAEGLSHYFDEDVYSDEVGLRKPNPEILALTARRLGVGIDECWYVGDNFDRDAVCGARAGVGLNVVLEAKDTYRLPFEISLRPDRILRDGNELRDLFFSTLAPL